MLMLLEYVRSICIVEKRWNCTILPRRFNIRCMYIDRFMTVDGKGWGGVGGVKYVFPLFEGWPGYTLYCRSGIMTYVCPLVASFGGCGVDQV